MDPSISGAGADTWILDIPSAEEIERAEESMAHSLEDLRSPRSAAIAVLLAAFVQNRNEMITCGMVRSGAKLDRVEKSEDPMSVTVSPEQIESAAKAMYASRTECASVVDHPTHHLRWLNVSSAMQESYRQAARMAAPYLQAPIEPPTESEVPRMMIHGEWVSSELLSECIRNFVDLRNAARVSEDPRRARIAAALSRRMDSVATSAINGITDEIILLLDAE